MNIVNEYILPTVPVAIVITFFVVTRLTRHRHFVFARSLSINALARCLLLCGGICARRLG